MKKRIYLASLLFSFFIFHATIIHSQTRHRLVIRVISDDRKEPIEGATVTIELKASSFSDRKLEKTDWEGMVYRDYDAYGNFKINAEAPGFYGSIREFNVARNLAAGDIPVTIVLKRNAGVKLVVVNVFEKGSGASIYDAQINLKGSIYSYHGSTNSSGDAVIAVDHGGNYTVTISHAGFKTVTEELNIKQYDDDVKEYNLSIEMTPSNYNGKRTMYVKVLTRKDDGELWGVPFANVTYSYESTMFEHNADEAGISEFTHAIPPGEQVTITVKMRGYKTQSRKINIKTRGIEGKATDGAVFTLVKDKDDHFLLYVEVLDGETNDPVPGASVELKKPDGSVEQENTNAKGEARFPGIEEGKPGVSAKVIVTKTGYKEKWSDITSDLMSGNENSERRFVVYISKKEGGVDWNGTYTDAHSKMTLSGSGTSLSGSWTYTVSDSKGTGTLMNCKVNGNTVTGNWRVQHDDDTKSGTRSGTFTATLSGNTLSGQFVEDTPKWNYKTGYSAANVSSIMHKGAVWPFTFTRKK